MEILFNTPRPSVPAAVRVPVFGVAASVRAHVPAMAAVAGVSTTGEFSKCSKSNSMGTVSYLAEGTAVSILVDGKQASVQLQTAKARMAQGGNARGIPPRGRPV